MTQISVGQRWLREVENDVTILEVIAVANGIPESVVCQVVKGPKEVGQTGTWALMSMWNVKYTYLEGQERSI